MNRIAGILSFDQTPVDPRVLDRMIGAMKFQVPDGQNAWIEGEVGLGCALIGKIAGADIETSPYRHPNGQWVITFDGRIDNRQELMGILRPEQVAGRARVSDEEILLAAYEKWELGCPKHLVGDFAFAIWDKKKHRLICARDHFGVKPFYYYQSNKSFVFASTPQALLASGKVPPVIHEERIADFLVDPLEGVDKTSSFYTGVLRLAPAHMLVIQPQGVTEKRFWQLDPTIHTVSMTEADHIEAFQELFKEAVRCRLQDTSAPASMLSGGMDSSAIVGMGRKVLTEEGKSLHAFAVISNFTSKNRETSHIFSVLNQGNVQSHLISETELFQWMDELVKAIESEAEPFDCLMNLNRAVYMHAQDHGLSTLLDGVDGDILLSDSSYLLPLWRQGAYRTIIAETLKAEGPIAEYKQGKSLLVNSMLSAFIPFAPDWFRNLRRPVRYSKALRSAVRDTIIDREFAIRSHLGERFATLDFHNPRLRSISQVESHKILLDQPFITVALERYGRVAGAFGIEARHPFLDVRLVEFCLGLSWQLKTHHGWTKLILRRALEPYLPPEVIWRKDKDSLMWEVNRLILKERADYFYQITLDEQENLKPYIDMRKLMKFWQDYLTLGDEKHTDLIWSGVALAMWLRHQRKLMVNLR